MFFCSSRVIFFQPAVEAFFLVHSTAINECRALVTSNPSSAPVLPRRNRGDGSLPLVPIIPGFDLGVGNMFERPHRASNVRVSVNAPSVPSTSVQAMTHGHSHQVRSGQNNSFGYIITEYRKFVQVNNSF